MYLRAVHSEHHVPSLRDFVRANPLGLFTTAIPSTSQPLIQISHIPWVIDVQDEASETELGILRGHMARANPQCKTMIEALNSTAEQTDDGSTNNGNGHVLEQEVLVLFNGPAHAYVTPKFYIDTKPNTGKVVPTWNYSAVQAYGRARIYFDPKSEATQSFLQKQISDLSRLSETRIMGYDGDQNTGNPKPWSVTDAPNNYVDLLRKAIIGIEIEITRLDGKFKMSQEMDAADRQGVVDGFAALGTDVGAEISRTVQQRGAAKDAQKSTSQVQS